MLDDVQNPQRRGLLRRGRWIEIGGGVYNAVEVAISLVAGFASGSSALIGWGFDSIVEVVSSGTMVWRLHGEERGLDHRAVLRRKRIALAVLSAAFFLASASITYEAVKQLVSGEASDFTGMGIAILLVALFVNPLLAWGKYRTGKQLGDDTLQYDAIDTLVCQYQTVVVLTGLILTYTLNWWWADPVAALAIVPYVLWESFEAGRDAWKLEPDREHVDQERPNA